MRCSGYPDMVLGRHSAGMGLDKDLGMDLVAAGTVGQVGYRSMAVFGRSHSVESEDRVSPLGFHDNSHRRFPSVPHNHYLLVQDDSEDLAHLVGCC